MRSRCARAVVAAAALSLVCLGAVVGDASGRSRVDFRIRVIAPVDAWGRPSAAHVQTGTPFRLRVELSTDRPAGVAAVSYDMFLPTDVNIPLKTQLVRTGVVTSRCLRVCAVGWDTARSHSLSVYYTLVPPGPGAFIVAARLVSTNGVDAVPENNTATATIRVAAARLELGVPELQGPPREGQVFSLRLAVRRNGSDVLPTSAGCVASVGSTRLTGSAVRARGRLRCSWRIPEASAGATLRAAVTATAGNVRGTATWSYAIRRPR